MFKKRQYVAVPAHLNGQLGGQLLDGAGAAAEAAEEVLDRGRDEEVLLLEAELLALGCVVVGVQHLGNLLSVLAVLDGLEEVALVEVLAGREKGRDKTSELAHNVATSRSNSIDGCQEEDEEVR